MLQIQSLLHSKRAQPHPLGLTIVLPPTDRLYSQVQLRIACNWLVQHMNTDVDGILWVTCHAGQGTLISSAKTPTEDGVMARVGCQTAQAVD